MKSFNTRSLFFRIHLISLSLFLVMIILVSCTTQNITKSVYQPGDVLKNEKFSVIQNQLNGQSLETVKIHMKNGEAYIFERWGRNANADSIIGYGQLVDINRNMLEKGKFSVDLKNIALIETDHLAPSLNYAGLAGSAIVTLGFGIYCITNPKACFGSCPTFYAWDGEKMKLMAEGFSSSILPSLEENDIDALWFAKPESNLLEIDLTNEAYETHVIRKANILAVPREPGARIIQDGKGGFAEFDKFINATLIDGKIDSSALLLSEYDGKERFSAADSSNLAEKEYLTFRFDNIPSQNTALIIASRQSLVTTYLFYQTLAYMGTKAGDYLSAIDSDSSGLKKQIEKSDKMIGGIDAEILIKNEWMPLGTINEKGPIASDVKFIMLPENVKPPVEIRLKMSKGYIRLDYVALAAYCKKADPVSIVPSMVYSEGVENLNAYDCLIKMQAPLITFPGDKYRLVYNLPENYQNYELFMDSKGYYLEWMRKEWQKEENATMVYMYFANPELYFKTLAPAYKKIEPVIENYFWSSRYVK